MIPILDLTEQYRTLKAEIDSAVHDVFAAGHFINGPNVKALEFEIAEYVGCRHAVGLNSGTDALHLALRALDIGPGDEVITTPLSAAYTALAVMAVGARPVFADLDESRFTVDPAAVEAAVTSRTRAILPVHLYGQPADLPALSRIAARHNLALVEDCCQAHLATCAGRPVGTFGVAGAFSFYPTKNLGALGDGGAIITGDRALAERLKRLRNGGQADRYRHVEPGVNSRLDELQAAVLRARLPLLRAWTTTRRALAARYRERLGGTAAVLPVEFDEGHVYHLFVIRSGSRDELRSHLASRGVETLVHYPIPIPRQPALGSQQPAACPIADRVCPELLSLPLHPAMRDEDVERVAHAIGAFRA